MLLFKSPSDLDRRRAASSNPVSAGPPVGAAYPQAALHSLNSTTLPYGDPVQLEDNEQAACCVMRLRAGEHLPIRMYQDRDLDSDAGAPQTDPLLGVLGTLQSLPTGWRAVCQVVLLEPAPANWARAYQRLALEHPISAERNGRGDAATSLGSVVSITGLGAAALAGLSMWSAWQRADWGAVALTTFGLLGAAGFGLAAYLKFGRRELHDPKLVQEKLKRDACRAELRLAVIAPGYSARAAVQAHLDRLAAAYRPFAVAAGNSFVPNPVKSSRVDLRILAPVGESVPVECARTGGPVAPATGSRRCALRRTHDRSPTASVAATVATGPSGEGCRIGTSEHQGHPVPGRPAAGFAGTTSSGDRQDAPREIVAHAPFRAPPDAGGHHRPRRSRGWTQETVHHPGRSA